MSAHPPRVLVIYKRTTYQRYRGAQSDRIKRLIDAGDDTVERLIEAHHDHLETIESARTVLKELGTEAVFRHKYEPCEDHRWDLVVTLGGDGTLLWSSHRVGPDVPMVAINSAPTASVGYFCAGDKTALRETLVMALGGDLKATKLTRMEVALDGEVVSTRILNDILFCHACPAATTRYIIELGDTREEQLSSGIWAGPAAGSTAAQRSAGGKVLPPGSQKLQFVVREPYFGMRDGYSLTRGFVAPGESVRFRSKIREARIFMDGAQRMLDVDIGAEVRLRASNEPLTLLGLRR
jgi:NAD+ kinase